MADTAQASSDRPAPPILRVNASAHGGLVVLTLRGELDMGTTQILREALEPLRSGDNVAVDLQQVSFIDSTGLGALVTFRHRMGDTITLVVRSGSQVERALQVTKSVPYVRTLSVSEETDAAGVAALIRTGRTGE
jgi:anti-anti-sigma factor